jgi:hypothetical protein
VLVLVFKVSSIKLGRDDFEEHLTKASEIESITFRNKKCNFTEVTLR